MPVLHSSELATSRALTIIDKLGIDEPKCTDKTVTVIGGGKSALDMILLMTKLGLNVSWLRRGPLKWFAPTVPPGMMGAK